MLYSLDAWLWKSSAVCCVDNGRIVCGENLDSVAGDNLDWETGDCYDNEVGIFDLWMEKVYEVKDTQKLPLHYGC